MLQKAGAMIQNTWLLAPASQHYLVDRAQSISILANQIGKVWIDLKTIVAHPYSLQALQQDIYDIEIARDRKKDITLYTMTILIIPHSKLLNHLRQWPLVIRYYNYILSSSLWQKSSMFYS